MKPCRECKHEISEQAFSCPNCGAPYPAKEKWDGWGYEYKSNLTFFGLPFLHISFKYRANGKPVVAKGIIAIGQFAYGIVTISQFGIGFFSVSQFTIAAYALAQIGVAYSLIAQFGVAYSLIAQFGLYIHEGHGMFVKSIGALLNMI